MCRVIQSSCWRKQTRSPSAHLLEEILIAAAAFRMKSFDLFSRHCINFHVTFLVYVPLRWTQIRGRKFSHAPPHHKAVPPDTRTTCNHRRLSGHIGGPPSCWDNDKQSLGASLHKRHHFCMDLDHSLLFFHKVGLQNKQIYNITKPGTAGRICMYNV